MSDDNGKVKLRATTYAEQVVDSIGITFYVQQWNGSAWLDVGSGTTLSATSQDTYDNYILKTIEGGYYYRGRTIHWVTENGTYEQGERISDYILVD